MVCLVKGLSIDREDHRSPVAASHAGRLFLGARQVHVLARLGPQPLLLNRGHGVLGRAVIEMRRRRCRRQVRNSGRGASAGTKVRASPLLQ